MAIYRRIASTVLSNLSRSSAHGISRAAGSTSLSMRIAWLILFLTFLGLFFNNAVTLVQRLIDNKIEKTYELDKVPFLFPDLYFCPSNPYSGSFPFALSPEEANEVNSEIKRLGKVYDDLFSNTTGHSNLRSRAIYIQNSMPVSLVTKYLAHRQSQSILQSKISSLHDSRMVSIGEFSHPQNIICFKVNLSEEDRHQMETKMYTLEIQLSTDPYFTDFSYSGQHIQPIIDPDSGEEILYQDWHPTYGIERLKSSGFTMLIVQKGTYPCLSHETKFQLAPGKAYTVTLQMQENTYSYDLYNVNCSTNNPDVIYKDYLTGGEANFTYSYSACYYREMTRILRNQLNCVFSHYPTSRSMRDLKRCFNLSESSRDNVQRLQKMQINWKQIETEVKDICRISQPCVHPEYSADFSFTKWPSVGSSAVSHFARMEMVNGSEHTAPATAQLIKIAKSLISSKENHSAHAEGLFRTYISESMISVTIVPESTMAAQVLISRSYSATAFLADTGGLLGLYIGCSLLTVCELLELIYCLIKNLRGAKKKGQQAEADGGAIGETAAAEPLNKPV